MLPFFSISSYLDIIKQQLEQNSGVKGYKSLLAKAAGFHTSYLSHVLSERAHISPEQAIAICDFWGFNEFYTDYFLALLSKERAGSERLRKKFEGDIERVRREAGNSLTVMSPRDIKKIQLKPHQTLYYLSDWFCIALHMTLRTPGPHTIPSLMDRFSLSEAIVSGSLNKLREMDLVSVEGEVWSFKSFAEVEESQGAYPKIFHSTMRQRANQVFNYATERDVFSTWVVSISKQEVAQLKSCIETFVLNRIKGSCPHPEEDIIALNIDLFVL